MAGQPSDELLHFLQQRNLPHSHVSPGGTYDPNPLPPDAEDLAKRAERMRLALWAQSLNPKSKDFVPALPLGPAEMYPSQNIQPGTLAAVLRFLK